ncbi:P-loop containing nucleoside triphosphate hydrolase protein [Lineolata rhizophorae]|uniref:P-loop containing nucleoside triphosphate hydrolase protein n=1 Tax=Lineolata rhizophorae TaxID=578093 RepID=A0A6A6NXW2_9PEZI|nr:P-loop containing nucleoside triphosphate hydrolase protein [Lineolata rhizophorae]
MLPGFGRLAARCIRTSYPRLRTPRRYSSLTSVSPAQSSNNAHPIKNLAPEQKSTVQLRGYQEECIQSVLSHLEMGHKRLGISLATGSGKTVIFTQLVDRIDPPTPKATQTLILVHRRELVEQAARHCMSAYPSKTVEIEMAGSHASGSADITVASVQSITSRDRIEKFDPARFKLVLVDEAHHIVASQYLQVLDHFGLRRAKESGPALVGVSATFSRFDGLKLGAAIDHIVYHRDYVDMIGEKWLSDAIFTTVETKADLSRVKPAPTGDFQTRSLSSAVNTAAANEITVRAWLARAAPPARKSTLVFCVDIQHVHDLAGAFRAQGVDARHVTSRTDKAARAERLAGFRAGAFPVLLNCGVFAEGTDVPNVDCVVLARPTRSRNLLVQMIGRGLRLCPGKRDCHVIDMVASLEAGVVTTPSLFGLDPDEVLEKETVGAMVDEMRRRRGGEGGAAEDGGADGGASLGAGAAPPTAREITFTDYDSVADLIADTSGERYIRSISRLAWVQVDSDRFVLSNNTGSYIVISKDDDGGGDARSKGDGAAGPAAFAVTPYMRPRVVARARGFEAAVRGADTFALATFARALVGAGQAWRRRPATAAQLRFLNRFQHVDERLGERDVSKGAAVDMITKLKHGARGRWGKMRAGRRRVERAERRGRELKGREVVRVGPVDR